ncbi:MAG: NAD-dependent epimerase/dehydratase family protein [Rhodobacteraceae bacterium]|nr:NAD-dependent epimerase/dehydratase family protein [Paracoccaceae bacterium]
MNSTSLHVVIGAGPLGRAVAEQALGDGNQVRMVTRSGKGGVSGADSIAADIMDAGAARAACEGADVVYQCAAPAYQNWPKAFPTLQENVLQGAARAGAVLVAAENLYAYGVAGRLHEGLPLAATTRKGSTRAALSRRLFEAYTGGELRTVSPAARDFFGPGVRVSAIGERLWPALLKGKPVDWFGNPDLPHSLTYVPDFARALVRLGAEERAWGRAWHVLSPEPLTPRQVIARMAALAGLPEPKVRQTPALMLRLVGLFVPAAGEIIEMGYSYNEPFVMDDSAYREAFGGTSTDWETALTATLAFWRSQ